MSPSDTFVEVVRGSVVESRHRVHVAVLDAGGQLRAAAGDPDVVTFFRSAAKPLQALPLVEDGVADLFELTDAELALCCGSHSGTPRHVHAAEQILQKAGVSSDALVCGPHSPFDHLTQQSLVEEGLEPGRLHNNCSGKHAGMLALARAHGWSEADYQEAWHPVQGRALAEVVRWGGILEEAVALGVDGCGVACFGMPLRNMALAYARFASAARQGETGPAHIVAAMTSYPEMVAGDGRICTELMRSTEGRVFAKVGAEGVYCVGVPGAELGIALKIEDGSARAVAPAILGVLRVLDLISEDDFGALHAHAYPDLLNTRGQPVGQLRPRIRMRAADA
jgi:L-asparaginase II